MRLWVYYKKSTDELLMVDQFQRVVEYWPHEDEENPFYFVVKGYLRPSYVLIGEL